jgi:thymidine kinase
MQKGKLELLMGPMRSNKTEELLRRVAMRREFAHQNVMLFKPSDDTKSAPGLVESRNPKGHGRMQALEFDSRDPWSIMKCVAAEEKSIGKKVESIAIDEGQFVDGLFLFTKELMESGYDVLVAGLDLDFRALPFGEMLDLVWLVNYYGGAISWCVSYCACGDPALFSQRLIDGKPAPFDSPIKMPGESYEPRCREHFVLPGKPKGSAVV